MFRFTIRDVLWLMVVVGLAVAWRLHHLAFSSVELRATGEANRLRLDNDSLQLAHKQLKQQVKQLQIGNDDLTKRNKRLKVLLEP